MGAGYHATICQMYPLPMKYRLWICLAIFLAGCETNVTPQSFPEMTFHHLAPIQLNVVDVQFLSDTKASSDASNIAFTFPTPPAVGLKRWAKDRIRAVGSTATARFVIHEASAKEISLRVDRGIGGLFKVEQLDRYDAIVEASLEIYDSRGVRRAFALARAKRSITIREDTTQEDRQRIWFELIERLMADFDRTMENNIRIHMTEYLL